MDVETDWGAICPVEMEMVGTSTDWLAPSLQAVFLKYRCGTHGPATLALSDARQVAAMIAAMQHQGTQLWGLTFAQALVMARRATPPVVMPARGHRLFVVRNVQR